MSLAQSSAAPPGGSSKPQRAIVRVVDGVQLSTCHTYRFTQGRARWLVRTKAGATIEVGHEKKVDLGVLRGADHDGLGPQVPFEMVSVD